LDNQTCRRQHVPHPASQRRRYSSGTFTVNRSTVPHRVDSIASGGANSGQITLGIYKIIDDKHMVQGFAFDSLKGG
jgi:hypothetical protein